MKVWEVESIGDHDDHTYTQGLYGSLEKAKVSVENAVWEPYPMSWHLLWANVDDGYEDDGEYFPDFTHYYITEREVL